MTLTDVSVAPIVPNERAQVIDVLRGFALLGILLMNIEGFVGPLMRALTGLDTTLSGADLVVDGLIYILVQGKFYTLFSLLFGAGFAMILQRAEQRGSAGGWLFFRRSLVLLGIGLLHFIFLWSGDILTFYALIAFVLLLFFRRTPQSRLPKWALVFYLLPLLLVFLYALGFEGSRHDPAAAAEFDRNLAEQAEQMVATEQAQRDAYGPGGSYAEATAQRLADLGWMTNFLPILGPTVLGLFLIGAWLLRSGALLRPEQHLPLFRRLQAVGFLLGLPLVLGGFWLIPSADFARIDFTVALVTAMNQAANLLLCLAYMSTLVLAFQSPRWQPRLLLLAPAGRMALTNYLLQSLVCVGIFYGHGLGYFEQLPRAWQVPFVLALYALQVALSHWWLARFRFGPAEWLWRSLTYLRPQPMRLATVA
jgi:uncharacterized protein